MLKTELMVRVTFPEQGFSYEPEYVTESFSMGDFVVRDDRDFQKVLKEVEDYLGEGTIENFGDDYRSTEFDVYVKSDRVKVELTYCLRIGDKLFGLVEYVD